MKLFIKARNLFSWVLVRYQKAYGLIGSFLTALNFVGIFTIILQPYIDLPIYLLMPLLLFLGLGSILCFGIFVFDKVNFQTIMTEKNGQLDDYWKTKMNPVHQKTLMIELEAIEQATGKKLTKLKKKVESSYL